MNNKNLLFKEKANYIYNNFCDFLLRKIAQTANNLFEHIPLKQKTNQSVENEIKEKISEICKLNNIEDFSNSIESKRIIKTFSFVRENIKESDLFKKLNIEKFKQNFFDIIKYILNKNVSKINIIMNFTISQFKNRLIYFYEKIVSDLESLKNNFIELGAERIDIINYLKQKKLNLEKELKIKNYDIIEMEIKVEVLLIINDFISKAEQIGKIINSKTSSISFMNKVEKYDLQISNEIKKINNEINQIKILEKKGIFEKISSYFSIRSYLQNYIDAMNIFILKRFDEIVQKIKKYNNKYFNTVLESINVNKQKLSKKIDKFIVYLNLIKEDLEEIFQKMGKIRYMKKIDNYIEKFNNLKEIGKGAFGSVYKANYKNKNEIVALKIISKESIKNMFRESYMKDNVEEEFTQYYNDFINEIEIMKICNSNNTNNNALKLYDYFETENEFVSVIELCDEDLNSVLIKSKKGFNKKEIFYIIHQLNNTFKIMVNNSIIHRDLKLENILIKYENTEKTKYTVKLIDFGVSKKLLAMTRRCKTTAGTITTMAPEILSEEEYNNECDLWSLGIIIYQLFFKEYPYKALTEIGILKEINNFGQRKLKKTGDKQLDYLISKLLIKDPKERMTWKEFFDYTNSILL